MLPRYLLVEYTPAAAPTWPSSMDSTEVVWSPVIAIPRPIPTKTRPKTNAVRETSAPAKAIGAAPMAEITSPTTVGICLPYLSSMRPATTDMMIMPSVIAVRTRPVCTAEAPLLPARNSGTAMRREYMERLASAMPRLAAAKSRWRNILGWKTGSG